MGGLQRLWWLNYHRVPKIQCSSIRRMNYPSSLITQESIKCNESRLHEQKQSFLLSLLTSVENLSANTIIDN